MATKGPPAFTMCARAAPWAALFLATLAQGCLETPTDIFILMDTSSAGRDVFYVVSHFTEMCSAAVAYKNHNPANPSNYVRTANILSTCTDISRCFSAGKGKEEQGGARGG